MKFIEKNTTDCFNPVTIELTLETKEELLTLWSHLNMSPKNVKDTNHNLSHHYNNSFNDKLWEKINKIAKRKGLL